MRGSPIEQLLAVIDRLDLEAVMALMAPEVRILCADGRRADGKEAVRELFASLLRPLRATTHLITGQWHEDVVWIAEVESTYQLEDWSQTSAVPQAFVLRQGPGGISDLRVYGVAEPRPDEHWTGEEGMRVGERWIPPL